METTLVEFNFKKGEEEGGSIDAERKFQSVCNTDISC
jgi:hypothetical protein